MRKQKQFDSQKFCDAYNAFASRKVTMAEAAKWQRCVNLHSENISENF